MVVLPRFGSPSAAFYLALIAAGLSAAAFLFGALRSFASYQGRSSFGSLELGGPVVAAFLVVIMGFKYAQPPAYIDIVIRPFGPRGEAEIVRAGTITLDLGGMRISKPVTLDGEVHFNQVPSTYIGNLIPIIVTCDGYETLSKKIAVPLDGVVYVRLKAQIFDSTMAGIFQTSLHLPVSGASIYINEKLVTKTDTDGRFRVELPLREGTTVRLRAEKSQTTGYEDYVPVKEGLTLLFERVQ